MRKNDKIIVILGVAILLISSIGIYFWVPENTTASSIKTESIIKVTGVLSNYPKAISVSDSNPFYALIATPLAINYQEDGDMVVNPLYVVNIDNPSNAVLRAKQLINIPVDLMISNSYSDSIKNVSLDIANTFWKSSKAALIIENNQKGYDLGVPATPIASYLSIPIIVTDDIDVEVRQTFENLGVEYTIICGDNIGGYGKTLRFNNIYEIINTTTDIIFEKFGNLDYIALTNPTDITKTEILGNKSYNFRGTISSTTFTPTHMVGIALGSLTGLPRIKSHEFEIPSEYKYAKINIHAENLVDEDVDETGSQLQPLLFDPDGNGLALAFTSGGIPERDSNGAIIKDQIDWSTIVYNQPGTYYINVEGQFVTSKKADYEIDVTIEQLNSSITPNMPGLSSIAPYLTAYRKGILYAKPEFTFVGDESIVKNIPSGVVYPASNPDLIDESNIHTYKIHESLNKILADINQISLENEEDLKKLKEFHDENPMYIALVGDARMIPQYYYYDTEDANSLRYGWDVASDFIYGNIDPIPRDDKISIHPKDKFLTDYSEKYPNQENIVGRITGWDVQDASALITRTIFYDNIINNIDDKWKETAVVQTGSGTDFQRVPGVDLFRKIIGAHDLPFKWPTGEAHFQNLIIQESLKSGGFEIRSTENTESMRRGHSDETLSKINRMGPLNLLLFPKIRVKLIAGDQIATGGKDQEESNYIFSFGHGQPLGYSHGDVQTSSLGFRPVLIHNFINRFFFGVLPALNSGLGNIGGYNVRAVSNMELGPSVVFVESCYIGRIDGFPAKALTSQAYIHAGVNTFIASSRGTPGPGYLDARRTALGFGISELIKTINNPNLQKPHFSALYAVNLYEDLTKNNVDIGTAFKNARNKFMDDVNSTFFWTPPLCLDIQTEEDLDFYFNNIRLTSNEEDAKCMEKKYTCLLEYNLFGDPAFNPYEPNNEGR